MVLSKTALVIQSPGGIESLALEESFWIRTGLRVKEVGGEAKLAG